jgi:hypothetical protein
VFTNSVDNDWEIKLWDYLSKGDGKHCPLYSSCVLRNQGHPCLDKYGKRYSKLFDSKYFKSADFNFIHSQSWKSSEIFDLVEKLAKKYLGKVGIAKPPVPPGIISVFDEEYPIATQSIPLKSYHGALWFDGNQWIIFMNENDSKPMRKFTIFHECFHIIAQQQTKYAFSQGRIPRGHFNELIADIFAQDILMPKEWVEHEWIKCRDLNEMAIRFQIPKTAMFIQLRWHGFI